MGNEGRSGGPQGSKSTRSSEEPYFRQPCPLVVGLRVRQRAEGGDCRPSPGQSPITRASGDRDKLGEVERVERRLPAPRYIVWIWTPEVHLIGPRCPYRHDTQWSDEEGRHDVRQSRSVQDGVGT